MNKELLFLYPEGHDLKKKKKKERFHEKEVWGLHFLKQLRKCSLVVLGLDEVGSTEPQKSYRPFQGLVRG